MEFIQSKITSARRATYACLSIGSKFNPVSPLTVDKIYRTQGLSRMLYGVEIANISDRSVKLLETTHWAMARSIQGLSKTAPNPTVLPSLGWLTIEDIVEKAKIEFLYKLLCLPVGNFYKKICILRINHVLMSHTATQKGPVARALMATDKFNLTDLLRQGIENGNWNSMSEWKKMTRERIQTRTKTKWLMTCMLYGKMDLYVKVMGDVDNVWIWWKVCKYSPQCTRGCMLLLRLLCGDRVHAIDDQRGKCCICKHEIDNKAKHILFECNNLAVIRQGYWQTVTQVMPTAMANDINNMQNDEKIEIVANGLNIPLAVEWMDIYANIAKFIFKMYKQMIVECDKQNE